MSQRIGIARAAQLLGISRRDIQKKIHQGELDTFEGELDLDELRRCYPTLVLDGQSAMLEHVRVIRQTAFARRVSHTLFPDQDHLERQVKRLGTQAAVNRVKADRYLKILQDTMNRLQEWGNCEDDSRRAVARELNAWLSERLQDP